MDQSRLLIVTTSILLTWAVVIIIWERVKPYRKGIPLFREGFWVDLVWYTIIQSYFLKIIIFDCIIYPVQQHYDFTGLLHVGSWPLVAQVLFFFVIHDFYIYWFHRLQHANKYLWRIHEAHHSVKEVDFLAGSRSHVLEIIINQTVEFAPIILLGASPEVVAIKALIDSVYGMFIHANIDVRIGKLKYIFNTPELHLWHHANYREVFHANFATKLSLWDYLFGSVYYPDHKPGNRNEHWGLYYDYPKDYFLQHAFSVKRFDEQALLRYKNFRRYYYLRPNIMAWFLRRLSSTEKPAETTANEQVTKEEHKELT